MKKLTVAILLLASLAHAATGVVVLQSGVIIGKEVYAPNTPFDPTSLTQRQIADPTLSFQTYVLPDATFDAVLIAPNQPSLRSSAVALVSNDPQPIGKIQRAAALVVLDRVNELREWLGAFKAATAAASSLANLQTRVAALPDMPDFNASQIQTAIQNKITQGNAD